MQLRCGSSSPWMWSCCLGPDVLACHVLCLFILLSYPSFPAPPSPPPLTLPLPPFFFTSPETLEDCSIVLPRAPPAVHPPAAAEESEPAMPDQPSSTHGQEPIAEGDCPTSEQDKGEHVGQT